MVLDLTLPMRNWNSTPWWLLIGTKSPTF